MWQELLDMGATIRPVDKDWPYPPVANRRYSQFSASFRQTVTLLSREIALLGGRHVAIGLGVEERNIRLDGMPRADARIADPRVMVAFTSKWGPVTFATDEFDNWRDNLRAIALSMEALRSVDRYGVSKRGEQYRGWSALATSTTPSDSIATMEQAQAWVDQFGGVIAAIKATHPDVPGGSTEKFQMTMKAKELLGQ